MRVLVLLLLVLLTAVPALAWAQTRSRGDRALFGGGVGNAEQVLSIGSNAGVSFFETLTGQPPSPPGETLPTTTRTSRASASLGYSLDVPYAQVGASLTGFSYYQPPPRKQWFSDYSFGANAGTGHTWRISPRSQFSATQSLTFQPAYQELLPNGSDFGSADPSQIFSPDVAGYDGEILSSLSSARFNYDFSRRAAFYSGYSLDRFWNFGRDDAFDRLAHFVSSGVRVELSRHLSVRGGYRFDATQQGSGMPYVRTHGFDFGVDYGRGGALRLTRRTTLSFGVGVGASADNVSRQRYFALGNVHLIREIGRTWSASISYSRNLDFSTLFLQPALTDDVYANFGGLISSRLSFQSSAGYSRSAIGFSGVENEYGRAHALVGLQSGLTRYIALGVNYTYYYRSIGQGLELPSGLTDHAESQAVHLFVSAWAPLYHRVRRPNGTR